MRVPRLSALAYRRVTLFALVALGFIIVTGGAVRLTGSGLGCPDWPTCDKGELVAPLEYHHLVEFGNRTITGLVSVAVILAVLGALGREPRRRDLTWLSCGLVAGVIAQIVLGGLTVLFELRPPWVIAHFLVSMALVADAVVLHHRAGLPDWGVSLRRVAPEVTVAGRVLLVVASVVLFTGTLVTGAGPHGGDEKVVRIDVPVPDLARVHGTSVMLLLALTLFTVWLLARTSAPHWIRERAHVIVYALFVQGAIGYVQYFSGVPAVLVGFHIAGAVVVWVAVLRFALVSAGHRVEEVKGGIDEFEAVGRGEVIGVRQGDEPGIG